MARGAGGHMGTTDTYVRLYMDLFITGSLERLIPEDHILARVNRVLDLGRLREEVADCYCADFLPAAA